MLTNLSIRIVALAAVLSPVGACRHTPPDLKSARQELNRSGVDFAKEGFIESAAKGDVRICTLFLEAGMDPDAADDRGRTALMEAAAIDQGKVVEILLARGANLGARDSDSYTALIHAAITGSASTTKALLDAGADVNASDNRGWTALTYSAFDGTYECAEILLERGANMEATANDGYTAVLLLAKHIEASETARNWTMPMIRMDRLRTLRLLVQKGANVNATNKDGETPLDLALKNNVPEVIEILKEGGANSTRLSTANPADAERYFDRSPE